MKNILISADLKREIIAVIPNITIEQKDYAYLYKKDSIAKTEIEKMRDGLKCIKKKLSKLLKKKAELDKDINYFEYKLLDDGGY